MVLVPIACSSQGTFSQAGVGRSDFVCPEQEITYESAFDDTGKYRSIQEQPGLPASASLLEVQ
jgi:hypothetical protein